MNINFKFILKTIITKKKNSLVRAKAMMKTVMPNKKDNIMLLPFKRKN